MRFFSCARPLLAAAVVSTSLLAAGASHADAKIAVVDMQKAILETNEGARALDSFKQTMEQEAEGSRRRSEQDRQGANRDREEV